MIGATHFISQVVVYTLGTISSIPIIIQDLENIIRINEEYGFKIIAIFKIKYKPEYYANESKN